MNYDSIPGINKPVSRLVQGTVMISSKQLEWSFELLDAVFALGCTTFDTAHGYGGGDNERTFGKWLKARGNRDEVVILGKGSHHSQDRRRVTPYDITADLHDSLARFQTDYIDLYVLHRDDPSVPVGPIVETLNEHKQSGLIHAFGGSNWSHTRVHEANEYAAANDLTPFAVSSPQFSLADQVEEPWDECVSISGPSGAESREWYRQTQMPIFTWSSLAGGFFSGRLRRDNLDTFTEYLDRLAVTSYVSEENFKRLDRTNELAAEKGLTLPQVAMTYVMSQPMNIFALVGCQNGAEFADNITASKIRLSEQEMEWLDLKSDDR